MKTKKGQTKKKEKKVVYVGGDADRKIVIIIHECNRNRSTFFKVYHKRVTFSMTNVEEALCIYLNNYFPSFSHFSPVIPETSCANYNFQLLS